MACRRAAVAGGPPPPGAAPWPDHHEPTTFQRSVMELVAGLRSGDLASYGELAAEAGRPGSAQAVANVLRAAMGLPWWRVVPSDGRLYRSHAAVQRPLLEQEGHVIDEHRRVRPSRPR
ncbi:MAG: hypothetical protein JWM89_1017 [Acidimicrobiales bacterium]|nr:hypothetical protein [Acidimicrobiales bacterium]